MKHRFLLIIITCATVAAMAQRVDTGYLKALYDRCIQFDESKADSLDIYAAFIARQAAQLRYNKGPVFSTRLLGIAQDLRGNYDKAIIYYLRSLDEARRLSDLKCEISAFNDLAYIYVNTKQPLRAKEMYLECAKLADRSNDVHTLVVSYGNLGAIYSHLNETDSALLVLDKAREIGEIHPGKANLSSVYNNIGTVYYRKKAYDKALFYFRQNYERHLADTNNAEIWTDELNLADAYTQTKDFDSAYKYGQASMDVARRLGSKSKEADSYSILAKLYSAKGDYRKAYDYQQKWYIIDTALVNTSTNKEIASLQERYHARQREQENKLLQAEVDKANLRNRAISYLAIAAAVIAIIIAVSLLQKRRVNQRLKYQNELIRRQNEKLSTLNYEKNSLISIVSHDLNGPFSSIDMWSQVLQSDASNLTEEQVKALAKIRASAEKGEGLIRTILDVEKAGTSQREIALENLDLCSFVEYLVADFGPGATGKGIHLQLATPAKKIFLVSDKYLLGRVMENLLSNALKFTPSSGTVWVGLFDDSDTVRLSVRDNGVGIRKEELPHLFSRYGRASSRPTRGEHSTGLGLFIVKRIVQELGGDISCESEEGQGSVFTVTLRK